MSPLKGPNLEAKGVYYMGQFTKEWCRTLLVHSSKETRESHRVVAVTTDSGNYLQIVNCNKDFVVMANKPIAIKI